MLNISVCTSDIKRPVGATNQLTTVVSGVRANLTNATDSQKLSQIALQLPGVTQANIQEMWRFVIGGYDENPLPTGFGTILQENDELIVTGDAGNPELTGKYRVISTGVPSPLLPIFKAWAIKTGS